ncbi:MAG TPA: DUF4097 family beta strand repeat-containing protein [Pyrinomonadaceae bacterium]|nr:DUF4097 family beta strand repeat-containing protein [Pyrinomonadaceae bacterium]
MKATSIIWLVLKAALATALLFLSTTILFGQEKAEKTDKHAYKTEKMARGFCSSGWGNSDKANVRDLREMTIPASGSISVDGQQNGGIKVLGSNRSDIGIRACVVAWGTSEEIAQSLVNSIKISTGGVITADAPTDRDWSVSYEISVPRNTNLNLKARNGGIGISGVEGTMELETMNGGVHLNDVAGDVKGRTTNGGVHVQLAGTAWRGNGLDVTTTNGGVHLQMSEGYAANIETGTVNGGFHSSIAALNVTREDVKGPDRHMKPLKINTALNGGGAPIRLITTNGGVHISSGAGEKDKAVY